MKHLITTAAIALLPMTALGGGLASPLDESPRPIARPAPQADLSWAGLYGGLQAGKTETTGSVTSSEDISEECEPLKETGHYSNKCVAPDEYTGDLPHMGWRACDNSDNPQCVIGSAKGGDLLWLNEPFSYVTDTITSTSSFTSDESAFGVFAGYRHQYGAWVFGGELSYLQGQDSETDILLADAHLGYSLGAVLPYVSVGMMDDGDRGAAYGLGADVRLGGGLFAGLKGVRSDDLDRDTLTARIGFSF